MGWCLPRAMRRGKACWTGNGGAWGEFFDIKFGDGVSDLGSGPGEAGRAGCNSGARGSAYAFAPARQGDAPYHVLLRRDGIGSK
jgi:hypothetical protein